MIWLLTNIRHTQYSNQYTSAWALLVCPNCDPWGSLEMYEGIWTFVVGTRHSTPKNNICLFLKQLQNQCVSLYTPVYFSFYMTFHLFATCNIVTYLIRNIDVCFVQALGCAVRFIVDTLYIIFTFLYNTLLFATCNIVTCLIKVKVK
jgi:hypothetical protein